MRRGAESLREQNVLIFDGLFKIALAEAEAAAGDPERAIAILDEALATADRLGYRAFEADLHRARGEMLLERDPANLAPAEEVFLTAIAVAKQQGARSFELRAALALAKLYQSTGRPADAHAVLAPALEGFAPTPEMPEIAEAQALACGARVVPLSLAGEGRGEGSGAARRVASGRLTTPDPSSGAIARRKTASFDALWRQLLPQGEKGSLATLGEAIDRKPSQAGVNKSPTGISSPGGSRRRTPSLKIRVSITSPWPRR